MGVRELTSIWREDLAFKTQQEKYPCWNPDSICHSDNVCFANKSPSVDKVSGTSGSLAGSLLPWLGIMFPCMAMGRVQGFAGRRGWAELLLLFLRMSGAGCPCVTSKACPAVAPQCGHISLPGKCGCTSLPAPPSV